MENKIGFLAFCFLGMTLLNRILEGIFIAGEDVGIMNTLTITHDETIYGLFTAPVINANFFFTGIPRLVEWNYSFFGGNAAIWQYFLYAFTFVVSFMLFIIIIGMISQFFARR